MTAIIKVSHLTKKFKEYAAVNDVSFEVEQGEVFGLLGPNGAGKSTTIKMLTTLLRPTSGEALVNGFDIVRQTTAVRHSIGYVPQALSADGSLSGYENLSIFAKLYDVPHTIRDARIKQVLSYVGLTDASKQLVRNYSGGMIRRLEVAQSLLHQPHVLFLDEPTVGLDPIARQSIWDHLMDLRTASNMTIFVTTHSMEEADNLCTKIGIMHHGKIAIIGTPDELKATIDVEDATLDDVFIRYAGDALNSGGSYRDASRARSTARRLG